jgi:hypothetical protein
VHEPAEACAGAAREAAQILEAGTQLLLVGARQLCRRVAARAFSPGTSAKGHYGDVRLDGLNVVALGYFEGNIWAGDTKATMGIYMDERADDAPA